MDEHHMNHLSIIRFFILLIFELSYDYDLLRTLTSNAPWRSKPSVFAVAEYYNRK